MVIVYNKLPRFGYCSPSSVEEAIDCLERDEAGTRILAGGIDLIPRIKRREVRPSTLLDIRRVKEFGQVRDSDNGALHIGAMASIRQVEEHIGAARRYPALLQAIKSVASMQVRMTGTVVGNVCVGTPGSDLATALLCYGAIVRLVGAGGERTLPLSSFFEAPLRTGVQPGEIVQSLELPDQGHEGAAFQRVLRTAQDCSKVSVAVRVERHGADRRIASIALGSVAPTPILVQGLEATSARTLDSQLMANTVDRAMAQISPITDIRSTSGYRRRMVGVLMRRAVEQAWNMA